MFSQDGHWSSLPCPTDVFVLYGSVLPGSSEERSVFIKASRKLLEPRRDSSSLLDLLGSEGFKDKPVQLQLHLARAPMWGQDLLLTLHVQRVPDRAHSQDPIGLMVRFCAQALLHGGSTREPFWKHAVRLSMDFEKGEYVAGMRRSTRREESFGSMNHTGLL